MSSFTMIRQLMPMFEHGWIELCIGDPEYIGDLYIFLLSFATDSVKMTVTVIF